MHVLCAVHLPVPSAHGYPKNASFVQEIPHIVTAPLQTERLLPHCTVEQMIVLSVSAVCTHLLLLHVSFVQRLLSLHSPGRVQAYGTHVPAIQIPD